jgi:hypothetical protein
MPHNLIYKTKGVALMGIGISQWRKGRGLVEMNQFDL